MVKTIYSVRDAKSGYGPLMMFDNDAIAMRAFSMSVNDKNSLMYHAPGDFYLYSVGSFDDSSGVVSSVAEEPRHVCAAVDVKESEKS